MFAISVPTRCRHGSQKAGMPKITKRLVDGLGPDDIGRVIRDEELTGFAVRLNADGSRTYL